MRKLLLSFSLAVGLALPSSAQRVTDALDRGLVAVSTDGGIFCSWRINAGEYYDVTYNIYRDGTKLNSEPLTVSNYLDASGTASSTYSVEAVVRGETQERSAAVSPWATNYLEIPMDHGDLTSTYVPNDACCADVDGDGELEILLKFDNSSDADEGYLPGGHNREYAIIEVYKLNGKKLWWIDLGPNMTDFQNNENNIVAYDWDGDGKAEAVLRVSDSTVVHTADGGQYVIGDPTVNARPEGPNTQTNFFVSSGGEYLLYLNGETGEIYQQMDYPLPRFDEGEYDSSLAYDVNLSNVWGDGYGHRSTKHFFGAPVLDGRNPSIFLARGIYTQHKMVAFDVDPVTHTLVERWRWNCKTSGSDWYAQGYHNYNIADVDGDGRDEIVFGSMVIDDNGNGLSTCGLGHGDALHTGDFDPYTPGLEVFACNEERPGNNYRDATTSTLYYRYTCSDDDGRALMGNFFSDIPGAVGVSYNDQSLIGAVARAAVGQKSDYTMYHNFRIYWDGDLCEEMFDARNSSNTNGQISKPAEGVIASLVGSLTNNDTKCTPCYQGDILGDWREEVIMRTADNNIRIYTTDMATPWRVYSLWHDFQYRNAMVWQMCGYNQPPHTSFFLGEMEGITTPPPPLTMDGRTEIANGATISSAYDDKHIMMCETGDMTVSVASGAQPYIFTDNAPSWVQGHDDNDNIDTTTYTHTLTGAAFSGSMRLVKQGDGILVLPNVTQTYTGPTDVWAGTLSFDGTMQSSRVWLNRHTTLISDGGTFSGGIEADYNAHIVPGGENSVGSITTDSLILNFGAVVEIDLFSDGFSADQINASVLKIGMEDWQYGPAYSTPVLRLAPQGEGKKVADGQYVLGTVGKLDGSVGDLLLEGLRGQRGTLAYEDGQLVLTVETYEATDVTWTGSEGSTWDFEVTPNFVITATGEQRAFVAGDDVTIDDTALSATIEVGKGIAPSSLTVSNDELDITISGNGLEGEAELVKYGAASLTLNNANSLASATLNGGTVYVNSLASDDVELGSLGGQATPIILNNNSVLGVTATTSTTQPISVGGGGATFEVANGASFTIDAAVSGVSQSETSITKSGYGSLTLGDVNNVSLLTIELGSVYTVEADGISQTPSEVEFVSGILYDYTPDAEGEAVDVTNAANFSVPADNSGTLYAGETTRYTGSLTGAGSFVAYAGGAGTSFAGDWSQFTGTVTAATSQRGATTPVFAFDNDYGLANATLSVGSGVTFENCGHDVVIGTLSLTGGLAGTGTYTIGTDGADLSILGEISSPVRKVGDGRWTVSTSAKFDSLGAVAIDGGQLFLNSITTRSTSMMGENVVTVNDGATACGRGTVQSLHVANGGSLIPGTPESDDRYGTFATVEDLTVDNGASVSLNVRNANNGSTSRSYLRVGGSLTLSGSVDVTLSGDYSPQSGDAITLWECAAFSGTPTVSLPELAAGLYWDTTDLLTTTGTIRVGGVAEGIASIAADEAVDCRLYTVGGILVGEYTSTMASAASDAHKLGVPNGHYVLRITGSAASQTVKVVVAK